MIKHELIKHAEITIHKGAHVSKDESPTGRAPMTHSIKFNGVELPWFISEDGVHIKPATYGSPAEITLTLPVMSLSVDDTLFAE